MKTTKTDVAAVLAAAAVAFAACVHAADEPARKMNILAFAAHPDDVEHNCAGTMAKFAKQGHKVFIATATSGNIGSAIGRNLLGTLTSRK